MIRFKTFYLTEEKLSIKKININKIFDDVKKISETSKSIKYKLLSKDRIKAKEELIKQLKRNKIDFKEVRVSTSSVPKLIIKDDKDIHLIFKPISGGMTETTLNSTITELMPLIFYKNPSLTKMEYTEAINKILKEGIEKYKDVFVEKRDMKSGESFINTMETSTKFEEKMDNAIAIYNYLKDLNKTKKIKNLWWTYRKKPEGVNNSSPADIVAQFTDDEMLGISLKAGGEKTKEPLLNTFVKPIKEYFESSIQKLKEKLYKKVYSNIEGLTKDMFMNNNDKQILLDLEQNNQELYNKYYDEALSIIKKSVISDFKNEEKLKEFILEKILKKLDKDVPIKIIKAFGKKWKEIEDDDILSDSLLFLEDVKITESESSKQNFIVTLKIKDDEDLNMKFSIRSNKPKGSNKLHQVPNLAVKYNGLV
jgi:hypothetical protein